MRARGRSTIGFLTVAGIALLFLGVTAGPALAKMPAFGLEVSPRRPAPGETVTVRVTIYADRERSEIARDWRQDRFDNLVGIYPQAAFTGGEWDPLTRHDLLTLYPAGPGVFEGSFRAPDEGSVVVAPFPGVVGYDPEEGTRLGYPAPVTVIVGSSASPQPLWVAIPLLAVVLGVFAARRQRALG